MILDYFLTLLITIPGIIIITNIHNLVLNVLCLMFIFGLSSILLISNGLELLGFIYLIVYVGAISILFLFVVMNLTTDSVGYKSSPSVKSTDKDIFTAKVNFTTLILLFSSLILIIVSVDSPTRTLNANVNAVLQYAFKSVSYANVNNVSRVVSNKLFFISPWTDTLSYDLIERLGFLLYSDFLSITLALALILLLVILALVYCL